MHKPKLRILPHQHPQTPLLKYIFKLIILIIIYQTPNVLSMCNGSEFEKLTVTAKKHIELERLLQYHEDSNTRLKQSLIMNLLGLLDANVF